MLIIKQEYFIFIEIIHMSNERASFHEMFILTAVAGFFIYIFVKLLFF